MALASMSPSDDAPKAHLVLALAAPLSARIEFIHHSAKPLSRPRTRSATYGCDRHGTSLPDYALSIASRVLAVHSTSRSLCRTGAMCAAKVFELRPAASHRSDVKTDPRTQLTRSPLGPSQAWTALRAVASRKNGPPVQYWRQRQLSQLQQDI